MCAQAKQRWAARIQLPAVVRLSWCALVAVLTQVAHRLWEDVPARLSRFGCDSASNRGSDAMLVHVEPRMGDSPMNSHKDLAPPPSSSPRQPCGGTKCSNAESGQRLIGQRQLQRAPTLSLSPDWTPIRTPPIGRFRQLFQCLGLHVGWGPVCVPNHIRPDRAFAGRDVTRARQSGLHPAGEMREVVRLDGHLSPQ